ncbi:MAG: spondin domain-containing protein [bacterium]|nr:spondin domain-containing protein [bacterium]
MNLTRPLRALACTTLTGLALLATPGPTTAAPGDATYSVTFDVSWSAETHPDMFPPSAHFSGLVGGTHNTAVQFWTPGTLASLGIKRMAEWGQQATLAGEVQAAITAGTAGGVLLGPAIATLPGSTSMPFTATPAHPLVTLVTMIAPSPDWFVGVMGLDLRPGGQWVDELTVVLFPWDAGTDSGATYTAGDQPTVPPVPLFAINSAPFTPGEPIGTFTFRLEAVASVPQAAVLTSSAYPNPFNPRVTIAWRAPVGSHVRVTIYDAFGRRVREIYDQDGAPERGKAEWDGRDELGRAVAAGSYVYVVEADQEKTGGRLTLVK